MKNIIKISFTIFVFLLVTACNQSSNSNIQFIEDSKHNVMGHYTYKFVGESSHFYFQTGKVYYGNKERSFLISNFKAKDNVEEDSTFAVNLYFDCKLLYGGIRNLVQKKEDTFPQMIIAESGKDNEVDEHGEIIGEFDSFFETAKEEFKTSIRMEAEYCIQDQCTTEIFKIKYLE